MEFIIPRDPNTIVPPMSLQNVTSINDNTHRLIFNLHHVALPSSDLSSSASVHFEIQSVNISLAYLFIYRFDVSPQLNSSLRQIDGWTFLCPSSNAVPCREEKHLQRDTRIDLDLSEDSVHRYFIDNQRTVGHQSVIFGLRELDANESSIYCRNTSTLIDPPRSDQPFSFTSNYQLRTFASGCYYLDASNQWRSDGLRVSVSLSSATNVSHCSLLHRRSGP